MKKIIHRVQGETLEEVCAYYNISKAVLCACNNVEGWHDGKLLLICKEESKSYVVLPADTIESIAIKFGISEKYIKEKNNIEKVFIGQKISL